jgi:hypothetical protein
LLHSCFHSPSSWQPTISTSTTFKWNQGPYLKIFNPKT